MRAKKQRKQRKERACRRCGCTWARACHTKAEGACSWVEQDLCSACLTPAERKRWHLGNLKPSEPTKREMLEALNLQITTLKDSFRGYDGYFTDAKYAKEVECLEAALEIVRAS